MDKPTPEQNAAGKELYAAGIDAVAAAHAFAVAIDQLRDAVSQAHAAGIPKEDVPAIVAGGRPLPGEVAEHLRTMIRRTYT